ncbi:conserved hypothetical protein [[Clostridium] ultunense Esp]|uniref:Glutamate synthase domain-containing protein n=1 Tax=[Clostridium] ultunense Esp TaxID=1288971 RepID=M1ZL40_9FIRM|nr:glutamate synthase-related protein [Schnuerera ultunensis]CCQ96537.1 conserved hypothetical protein [[Clostridium] ultunense Esp]SHD76504.1 conserved protein of unknown function [[Clostridium] ultunense Esp]
MSYSPSLSSTITKTRMRTPENVSSFSGMCSTCTTNCIGTCEIGSSAIRGEEALYPIGTDKNQFASEKIYPVDFSHFNINGRVFGTKGINTEDKEPTYPNADIFTTMGYKNPIKLKAPIILPAIAKLNWKDYYAGAALSGLLVVIGEDVISKDSELVLKDNRVVKSPLLEKMTQSFKEYHHGYGQIILQGNVDDENLGVLDYAIEKLGVTAVELKFGQGAKGIQGMGQVNSLEEALKFQNMGYLIYPDPSDPVIQEKYKKGVGPHFDKIGRLPMWDEEILSNRIEKLRELGAKQVCFKMAPYDPEDILRVLKIASQCKVDLVTFDGAGGGSGNSPCKMMNEWGFPTVYMESIIYELLKEMERKNYFLPKVAVAGGFTMEDHIFKGLSLGAPYISMIGIGRAAMASAMIGEKVGELIKTGNIPKDLLKYGNTVEEIFTDIRELKDIYGSKINNISTGAVGLYSYINRVSTGLKQLMALNRKFTLDEIGREDIIALTKEAAEVAGIPTFMDLKREIVKRV